MLEARRFVLSFGRHAKALAPRELVAGMRDEALEIARAYDAGRA
jgi:predicted DNA-binding transcriptional regulator YafY